MLHYTVRLFVAFIIILLCNIIENSGVQFVVYGVSGQSTEPPVHGLPVDYPKMDYTTEVYRESSFSRARRCDLCGRQFDQLPLSGD